MGALYDKLRASDLWIRGCLETGLDCGDPQVTVLAKFIHSLYGGPIYPTETCPAGPEPPSWQAVMTALDQAATSLPGGTLFSDEDRADLQRYLAEEFDRARAAWVKRVQYCGSSGSFPLPKPPKEDKPMDPDTVGALALVALGIGLYLWGRKR